MSDSGGTASNDPGAEPLGGDRLLNLGTLVRSNASLAAEVAGLRVSLGLTERKRRRDRLVILLLLALTVFSALNQSQIRRVAERDYKQAVGAGVAVCAIQNVLRIEVTNFLTKGYNMGALILPGDTPEIREANAKREAWLAEGRDAFALVPCETLVQDDRLEIRLEYPSTIPLAPSGP